MSTPQVARDHYASRDYNSKERLCSYWHQVDEVTSLGGGRVLEVGPGGGVGTFLLRLAGLSVTTVDIDPAVGADVQASVQRLPFDDGEFDVALCCQVLEHMPWQEAASAMRELRRVVNRGTVISVPNVTPWAGVATPLYWNLYANNLRASLSPTRRGRLLALLRGRVRLRDVVWLQLVPVEWAIGGRAFELPQRLLPHRPWEAVFDGEHYWELGLEGHEPQRVRSALAAAGLTVRREFRVPEHPYHHFFTSEVGQDQ
jgi:SAM-dependent methyltransferase